MNLLVKFERIGKDHLDFGEKYMVVLQRYSRDLDMVRKLYQKHKDSPPTPRNVPPVSILYSFLVFFFQWATQIGPWLDLPDYAHIPLREYDNSGTLPILVRGAVLCH